MPRQSTLQRLRARHAARRAAARHETPVYHKDPGLQQAAEEILRWVGGRDQEDGCGSTSLQLTSWMMEAARKLGFAPEYVHGYRISTARNHRAWNLHNWVEVAGETIDLGSAYEELLYRQHGRGGQITVELHTDPAALEGCPRFWTGSRAESEDKVAELLERYATDPVLHHQALLLAYHPPGYYDSLDEKLAEIARDVQATAE